MTASMLAFDYIPPFLPVIPSSDASMLAFDYVTLFPSVIPSSDASMMAFETVTRNLNPSQRMVWNGVDWVSAPEYVFDGERWLTVGGAATPVYREEGSGIAIPLDTVDYKGIIWRLGTDADTKAFANPHNVTCFNSMSSRFSLTNNLEDRATDRGASTQPTATDNISGPAAWWQTDLGIINSNRAMKVTHVAFRQRQDSSSNLAQEIMVEVGASIYGPFVTAGAAPVTKAQSAWTVIPCNGSIGRVVRLVQSLPSTTSFSFLIGEVEIFGEWYP